MSFYDDTGCLVANLFEDEIDCVFFVPHDKSALFIDPYQRTPATHYDYVLEKYGRKINVLQ